jgi:outer membrane lipoprotein-sorting protein
MPRPTVKSPLRLAVAVILGLLALYLFASFLVDTYGVRVDADAKEKPQKLKSEAVHVTQVEEYLYDSLVEGKYTVVIFKTKYGMIWSPWRILVFRRLQH